VALGGPISGFILDHAHWFGLSSWRWLLILEGLPAATLAFLVPFLLPSKPGEARFLTTDEKAWIADQLEREDQLKLGAKTQSISLARTLVNPRVWHLACIGFCHGFAGYTFSFWLPQVMKSVFGGQPNTAVGIAVMIPNLLGLMKLNPKPIRIEPAFEDREQIRDMFERNAPYRALAAYAPEGVKDETHEEAKRPVLPWFRGDWALGGRPLVERAELILHNKKFLEAARTVFGTSDVYPEFVAVNINGPMPACNTHVDNPSFYGATRVDYPLPFLTVMGFSGLFDEWRVVQASAISWFYEGAGGSFDYWPDGLDGPMLSEQPPFGNVALISDNGQLYHRVDAIGDREAELPQMSASVKIQPDGEGNWTILENGEVRATYPLRTIRLSVLCKAEVRDRESRPDSLTLDRTMEIFIADLRRRGIDYDVPSDPPADTAWILMLQGTYVNPTLLPTG
jgi:hypothetical protein